MPVRHVGGRRPASVAQVERSAENGGAAQIRPESVRATCQVQRRRKGAECKLRSPGWNERARSWLENLIRKGAGKGLPVVFDFDNTLICGDVSEATLAVLTNSGKLEPSRVPETLSPAFRARGQPRCTLASSV